MTSKKKILATLSVVMILGMAVLGILAYLTSEDGDANVMTLGNVNITQIEKGENGGDFVQDQDFYPGTTITKEVSIENTGKSAAYVRTWFAFEYGDAESYAEVVKTVNTGADWTWTWFDVPVEINDVEYIIAVATYNGALEPGATTADSLQSVMMNTTATNETMEAFDGKYEILAYSQGIQTVGFANATEAFTTSDFGAAVVGNNPWDAITFVSTEAELNAAVAAGGEIALTSDIVVDGDTTATVGNGTSTVLDLNNFTITATSDNSTGNRNVFDVNGGELTVKDGTIEYRHEGTDMGWNSSTNVFNVTAGGVLNIENATIVNAGGSSMAFVVHLNNWGEVTLNVENSTLESTYVPVRVFNSGYDMNNVSIEGSTLTGATNAFWVQNYTVADFGTAAKAEAQAALLNFDIKSNNTFNGYLRFGFTDSESYTLADYLAK